MPAGDVFGLDGFFLNKSNPITVSAVDINSTAAGAGITVVSGILNVTAGIATLTFSNAAGLSTTPFYVGAKIAVSGLSSSTGVAFTGYNGNFVVTGFAGTTTVSYATTGYFGGVTAGITTTGLVMLVTDTTVTNTTWSTSQTSGYFGGGYTSGSGERSTVDRTDFSNDTVKANVRGPLTVARAYLAAAGNSNYGWFSGASNGSVDRVDYSNDSSTASVRGPLNSGTFVLGATGNSNYGWFGGGQIGPGVIILSSVDRIDFSNDSGTALSRGPFSIVRRFLSAATDSNYGWYIGGQTSQAPLVNISTVDRINFTSDSSTASIRGPLVAARGLTATTGNLNYCWVSGGSGVTSRIERIDFSNDLVLPLSKGPLSGGRYSGSATGNFNYGYFGGGQPSTAVIDRVDFSNDSVAASIRGALSAARGYLTATSGQARSSSVRLGKTGGYGWFGGTQTSTAVVDRIDFANDATTALQRGPLTLGRGFLAATANTNYGWFGGGSGAGGTSRVDRVDFANDSGTTAIRGPLSSARGYLGATGNSNYGWFGGGYSNPPAILYAVIDRIDYSNDSVQASARSALSVGRSLLAATGNSNFGWFAGGSSSSAIVDRVNFSNDAVAVSPRGPLSAGRYAITATGNSNYGWFGGGYVGGIGFRTTLDRIDFSNDSVSTTQRGLITRARYGAGATGNYNYGYFGGGYLVPAAYTETVDRIDFSNDLVLASVRGSLTTAKYGPGATSNNIFT